MVQDREGGRASLEVWHPAAQPSGKGLGRMCNTRLYTTQHTGTIVFFRYVLEIWRDQVKGDWNPGGWVQAREGDFVGGGGTKKGSRIGRGPGTEWIGEPKKNVRHALGQNGCDDGDKP